MTSTAKPLIGRSGLYAVTWLLAIVAAAASAIAVLAPLYRLTQAGGYVTILRGDAPAGVAEHLPDGVRVVSSGEMVTLAVDEIPTTLRVLTTVGTSLTAVAVAAGAWWLARLIRSIRSGRPFDGRNPARLAGVAAAIVLGGTVAPLAGSVVDDLVVKALDLFPPDSPFIAVFHISLLPIGLAVLVLAVAEAFRRGGTLADDVDGLV